MPSFNRILVLAVVALSASVHSAPVADAAPRDLANVNGAIERSVVPAPASDFDDEDVAEDLEARDFDDEDEDEDVEAREIDEEDNDDEEDLEARDFDGEGEGEGEEGEGEGEGEDDEHDDEDSALERRAKPKTTKAAKPKTTKVAKPKTTKAKTTKVKATKAPKPTTAKAAKTTKAKTTKAKTTAKATATKPAKTTKAAKPTKSAKVTKTKASKTTKASATAKASACPIKKPTKPAKKTRMFGRAFDYVAHLFARDNEEFIGWHGTNSDTATFWEEKGQLEKPTKADGVLDFLGLGPKGTTAGTSGADAEIGPGVYVTDDQDIAVAFANNNAKVNPGTTAQLCAIFAKSSSNWRTALRKSFIPENLVGDSSNAAKKKQLEDARLEHIKKAVPGVSASSVVKFSLLNRSTKSGQLVLPATITNQFLAKCFKADGGAAAPGTNKFPAFSYNGQTLRTQWNIAAETAGECA